MTRKTVAIDPEVVGQNFRLLRERLYELTQEEMAALCGVSRSTLRRVEEGAQLPSLDLIYKAGRLDANLTYLMDHICSRRFSEFGIDLIIAGGIYQRALENSSSEFIGAWYSKVAADLRVLASSVRHSAFLAEQPTPTESRKRKKR